MGVANPVAAVLVADVHLSHQAPAARSAEPDWYAAMRRPLAQIRKLQQKHDPAPVVYAGDVFDDGWRPHRCPPELVNFALKHLPAGYAVPGQHDLPHHRLADVRRSAYWTLVESGRVTHLDPGKPVEVPVPVPLRLWGFPWGVPVTPLDDPVDFYLEVAVVHAMVWSKVSGFAGAPDGAHVNRWRRRLRGYDVAVFGDNHRPFQRTFGVGEGENACVVWNNGGLMRRRIDEKGHRPRVGLLRADGSVEAYHLDCSKDVFADDGGKTPPPPGTAGADLEAVLDALRGAEDRVLDFRAAVLRELDRRGADDAVRGMVLKAMGG